ncbi:MAG TPA: DUF4861 family protein [Tepidisphaeraceae bacterium]|jgi:hypothetical protein|nr:DUF4861 family protein [Tepidisphaeraceae bacterium]
MRNQILLAVLTTASLATLAPAADWLDLKDFGPVTQRVSVTVENPADVADPAALVHIRMADLRKVDPDANFNQVCVVDPDAKRAKREAADGNFIPFQINAKTLIFTLPLKPHEKKEVFVYTAPAPLNTPGFPSLTAYDSRHAYRSFENKYAAFRMETGPGANTTGMAIDLFGKTKAGDGLRLVELYGTGHDSYHKLNYWGVDILKVGSGPGDGGVYVIAGDQQARPTFASTTVTCLYQGPVETKLRVSAPVEIAGKKVTVVRFLTLVGEDRAIHDQVTIQGDDLTGLQLGIGVRDLPNCVWVEHPDKGYAFQTGDANQANYKAVGMGITFAPSEYVKTLTLPEPDNGGHIYVLNSLNSHHRIYDIWDMDGQLPKNIEKAEELRAPFESWLSTGAALDQSPLVITLGDKAESKP